MDDNLLASLRLQAAVVAHRVLLAHLVQRMREALPTEADPRLIDETMVMLRNSTDVLLTHWPEPQRSLGQAMAGQEIDEIMAAVVRDNPRPPATNQPPG